MLDFITIAGIKIYNSSLSSLLSHIKISLTSTSSKPTTILTANPEIVVQAQDDLKLREILNKSWATIPDGIGILWAANIQKKTVAERITGVRLTQELLELAEKQKLTIGVIGGTEQASLKYQQYLKRQLPTTWTVPGPWIDTVNFKEIKNELNDWFDSPDGEEFLKQLKKTDILFVTMGAPKQEYFIDYLTSSRHTPKNVIALAVGGTFDELSGIVPKTPDWIGKIGMKWLHRLITQPSRFKRQTRLFRFIRLVTTQNN